MAKKKTHNKELKIKEVSKVEAVKIPNTELVEIIFLSDNKIYIVGNQVATVLINSGKAKLK